MCGKSVVLRVPLLLLRVSNPNTRVLFALTNFQISVKSWSRVCGCRVAEEEKDDDDDEFKEEISTKG